MTFSGLGYLDSQNSFKASSISSEVVPLRITISGHLEYISMMLRRLNFGGKR